jgi:PEP-CTERM motif
MQSIKLSGALGGLAGMVLAMMLATPVFAQNVAMYTGTLMVGFGDAANKPPNGNDFGNDAVPACAATNVFAPQTFATLTVKGFVDQLPQVGTDPRALVFESYAPLSSGGNGGQAPIATSTCRIQFPPFIGNQLRSRLQVGRQVWPGRHLNTAKTDYTNVPGGGGGTVSKNGGPDLGGAASTTFNQTFYQGAGGGGGQQSIAKGSNNFGGAVPIETGGFVKLGIWEPPFVGNGGVPLVTFGVKPYVEGLLPTGPNAFGTSASDAIHPTGGVASGPFTWTKHDPIPTQWTPNWMTIMAGPTTTLNYLNYPPLVPLSVTAEGGWQQGAVQTTVTTFSAVVPLTTMGDFKGLVQKWTTGMVQHTDMSGMYVTQRTATGHDWTSGQFASNTTTAPDGTTRKLQLVTPWSSVIKKRGTAPWAVQFAITPDLGFGGLAVLTLDIQHVPEPGTLAMLGFGATGLVGLARLRRKARNS